MKNDCGWDVRCIYTRNGCLWQGRGRANREYSDRTGRVDAHLSFRRVLYVVCFLLGNSPASEFYKPTFRNPLSVPSS